MVLKNPHEFSPNNCNGTINTDTDTAATIAAQVPEQWGRNSSSEAVLLRAKSQWLTFTGKAVSLLLLLLLFRLMDLGAITAASVFSHWTENI